MPKRINFTLSEEQERELQAVAKSDQRAAVRQRAPALRMLSQGHTPQVVAQAFSLSEVTVDAWWQRDQRDGGAGLANQPKGHPPVQAAAAYFEQLETALAQAPSAYGYDFAIGTVERLRDHLQQRTGVPERRSLARLDAAARLCLSSSQALLSQVAGPRGQTERPSSA